MSNSIVSEVLSKLSEQEELLQSINVSKHLAPEVDLGNLLLSDLDEVSVEKLRQNKEQYLTLLARDNLQYLINQIFELPTERVEEAIVAKVPEPTSRLPREKPVPKAKPLSKWAAYAKEKGIVKRKKGNLEWDEELRKWVPRFGYKKAEAEKEKNWVRPVPRNADPNQDQFAKAGQAKEERVAKNELKRLQNIARNTKKAKKPTLEPSLKPSGDQLDRMVYVAHTATASMGKFQKNLKEEKTVMKTGKKRQFQPLISNSATEKAHSLEILDRIQSKKPRLDVEKAVNRMTNNEEQERGADHRAGRSGKKGGKKGKGRGGGKRGSGKYGGGDKRKSAGGKSGGGGDRKSGGKKAGKGKR